MIRGRLGPVGFMTSGWERERSWDQTLHLTADNSHRNRTVPRGKPRDTTGTHHLRVHLIWRPGPAVAEVWYNIRLTLCTSLRACWTGAGSKSQGHASLGPDREIVLLVSLCLIFSPHYFIFSFSITQFFFLPLPPSLSFSLSLFFPSGCSSWGQYPPLCCGTRTQESHE